MSTQDVLEYSSRKVNGVPQSPPVVGQSGRHYWAEADAAAEAAYASYTQGMKSVLAAAGDDSFASKVKGDAQNRFTIDADGTHSWGPGTGGADASLARSGVGVMALTGSLTVSSALTLSARTAGQLLFVDSSKNVVGSSSLTWDNVNPGLNITSVGIIKDQSALTITYPVSSGGTGTNGLRIKRTSSPYDYDLYLRGGLFISTWFELSGHAQNLGTANYEILPPTSDPHMLGIWSDVNAAAVQIRCNDVTSPNRALDVVDATAGTSYLFSIGVDGSLRWGVSTYLLQDVNLYRSAADILKTDDTFFAAIACQSPIFQGGTGVSGNVTIRSTSDATKGKILFGNSGYDEPTNRLILGDTGGNCKLTIHEVSANAAITSTVRVYNAGSGAGTGAAIELGYGDSGGNVIQVAGFYDGAGRAFTVSTNTGTTAVAERFRITPAGNVVVGTAAVSTSATDGFLYITTCAGTPSGAATSLAGRNAVVFDTTNNKLCVYNVAWKLIPTYTQATGGENITNSVTSGGTSGTIANYTDLTIYANDAAAIRNNIYQLARALKQDHDQLRAMGILS